MVRKDYTREARGVGMSQMSYRPIPFSPTGVVRRSVAHQG